MKRLIGTLRVLLELAAIAGIGMSLFVFFVECVWVPTAYWAWKCARKQPLQVFNRTTFDWFLVSGLLAAGLTWLAVHNVWPIDTGRNRWRPQPPQSSWGRSQRRTLWLDSHGALPRSPAHAH
jgi:hypothetical protein